MQRKSGLTILCEVSYFYEYTILAENFRYSALPFTCSMWFWFLSGFTKTAVIISMQYGKGISQITYFTYGKNMFSYYNGQLKKITDYSVGYINFLL